MADVPQTHPPFPSLPWDEISQAFGYWYWTQMILACGGNVAEMSRRAHVNRTDLYKRLGRYGISLPRRHYVDDDRGHPRDLDAFRQFLGAKAHRGGLARKQIRRGRNGAGSGVVHES